MENSSNKLNSSFNNFYLFLVIFTCLIKCSLQQDCPFTDINFRRKSTWSMYRQTAIFIPTTESEAVENLLIQTSELHEIMNHFKHQYVSPQKCCKISKQIPQPPILRLQRRVMQLQIQIFNSADHNHKKICHICSYLQSKNITKQSCFGKLSVMYGRLFCIHYTEYIRKAWIRILCTYQLI